MERPMAGHAVSLDSRLRGNDRIVVPLATFDDRIGIWSVRRFSKEIVADCFMWYVSAQCHSIIAGAFHRTGAVECWGRGTNRVIAECERHGAAPPFFEERQGFVIVTFRAPMVPVAETATAQALVRKTSEKTSEKILALMARHPEITIA